MMRPIVWQCSLCGEKHDRPDKHACEIKKGDWVEGVTSKENGDHVLGRAVNTYDSGDSENYERILVQGIVYTVETNNSIKYLTDAVIQCHVLQRFDAEDGARRLRNIVDMYSRNIIEKIEGGKY